MKSSTPWALNSTPIPATIKLPQNMPMLTARILADSTTMAN